jgi:hypothetical protein
MNIYQIQEIYNKIVDIKNFYKNHGQAYNNYKDVCIGFDNLLNVLESNLSYSKRLIHDNTQTLYKKLLKQNLEQRLNFIKLNNFHEDDVEKLKKILIPNIANNIPALELFPGIGQFLPHVVASEPLYVADKFIEICEVAADSLQNDFYKNRRLRKYVVNDYDLTILPHECFGLIYCFNEFCNADIDYIYKWSVSVYNLLYNGGKFIFNFMPDDQIWAQEANMKLDYTAIDYKLLIKRLTEFGYELESYKIQPFRSSHIVVKKPGETEPRIKVRGGWAEIIDN